MDQKDRDLINVIQSEFPITPRPFSELADSFRMSEEEVIERVRNLKESGIIRRIGGNFHSNKLCFTSTLCAAKVPEEKLEGFVEEINGHIGVTHNYLRTHEYNVWFTFIAESMDKIEKTLKEVAVKTGVSDILNLPAIRTFKIKVDFEV